MPGRDGTGPLGNEKLTGRGLGNCIENFNFKNNGYGMGMGRGRRSNYTHCQNFHYHKMLDTNLETEKKINDIQIQLQKIQQILNNLKN